MMYEISKEIFKQRLCDKLNFALVEVSDQNNSSELKDTKHLKFDGNFTSQFKSMYPNLSQNIVLFSLKANDESPANAAKNLADSGYHYVYYYSGTSEDLLLDKGLN